MVGVIIKSFLNFLCGLFKRPGFWKFLCYVVYFLNRLEDYRACFVTEAILLRKPFYYKSHFLQKPFYYWTVCKSKSF